MRRSPSAMASSSASPIPATAARAPARWPVTLAAGRARAVSVLPVVAGVVGLVAAGAVDGVPNDVLGLENVLPAEVAGVDESNDPVPDAMVLLNGTSLFTLSVNGATSCKLWVSLSSAVLAW